MAEFDRMGSYVLRRLAEEGYTAQPLDLGPDARLSKKGMHFSTKSFEIKDLGHLCVMTMNAMMGLMKMETVVLSVTAKDAPLINLDWISAMGKTTFMAEFYDCQLSPLPPALREAYAALQARDGDLPAYESGPHWYDSIRYPFTYARTAKGAEDRFLATGRAYFDEYLRQLSLLPACDPAAKAAKIRTFAETLFTTGGPAVDQVKALFGDEIARRLVCTHMYGV